MIFYTKNIIQKKYFKKIKICKKIFLRKNKSKICNDLLYKKKYFQKKIKVKFIIIFYIKKFVRKNKFVMIFTKKFVRKNK